ncbi:MAG: HlyD family efflux transporter periplasmic adaptor subunit, partial [Methyloprofundus sp.]|nr:HlyD family efflux transporter periplasmic adaptor subunit [Methyloprofundus sp.]
MTQFSKYLLTASIVLIAVAAVSLKYWHYITNPWTRDGQVMSYVIQVTPRVTGPIVKLPIKNNQSVKAGDLLFEIDPRTFKVSLDQARGNYDQTLNDLAALEEQVEAAKASVDQFQSEITEAKSAVNSVTSQLTQAKLTFDRNRVLVAKGTISKQRYDDLKMQYEVAGANKTQSLAALLAAKSALLQSQANLAQAKANLGAPGDENARLRIAKAAVDQAVLNLEFTKVKASVDGYVTNLTLQLGSQAVANQPALALVDVNSYWVDAYFRETLIGKMKAGDEALVTLMSYPDTPIRGKVDSLGWGLAQSDGSTGYNLLPNINPTFEWIRLAQRIPVRIHLDELPEGVKLRIGTTASVLVKT